MNALDDGVLLDCKRRDPELATAGLTSSNICDESLPRARESASSSTQVLCLAHCKFIFDASPASKSILKIMAVTSFVLDSSWQVLEISQRPSSQTTSPGNQYPALHCTGHLPPCCNSVHADTSSANRTIGAVSQALKDVAFEVVVLLVLVKLVVDAWLWLLEVEVVVIVVEMLAEVDTACVMSMAVVVVAVVDIVSSALVVGVLELDVEVDPTVVVCMAVNAVKVVVDDVVVGPLVNVAIYEVLEVASRVVVAAVDTAVVLSLVVVLVIVVVPIVEDELVDVMLVVRVVGSLIKFTKPLAARGTAMCTFVHLRPSNVCTNTTDELLPLGD